MDRLFTFLINFELLQKRKQDTTTCHAARHKLNLSCKLVCQNSPDQLAMQHNFSLQKSQLTNNQFRNNPIL
jgi:hypothetical protein